MPTKDTTQLGSPKGPTAPWDAFACITYLTDPAGLNPPIGSLALCTLFP